MGQLCPCFFRTEHLYSVLDGVELNTEEDTPYSRELSVHESKAHYEVQRDLARFTKVREQLKAKLAEVQRVRRDSLEAQGLLSEIKTLYYSDFLFAQTQLRTSRQMLQSIKAKRNMLNMHLRDQEHTAMEKWIDLTLQDAGVNHDTMDRIMEAQEKRTETIDETMELLSSNPVEPLCMNTLAQLQNPNRMASVDNDEFLKHLLGALGEGTTAVPDTPALTSTTTTKKTSPSEKFLPSPPLVPVVPEQDEEEMALLEAL